ncbi:MAG: hypothetical protein ACU85V_20155, partial [Gammaproteobacteria bacterium]
MKPSANHRLRRPAVVALAGLTFLAAGAEAVTLEWQNLSTGDWFDGANWDGGGAIPTAADTAVIANGGTAQATSGGPVLADNLLLGGADATFGAVQSGSLEATAVSIVVGGATIVGSAGSGVGAATGMLMGDAGLSSGQLRVGTTAGAAAGSAVGTVGITAGNVDLGSGSLLVGRAGSDGSTAQGTVQIDAGGLTGSLGGIQVGAAFGAGASASGSLTANSLTSTNGAPMGSFLVGRDSGGGGGTGALVVDELSLASSV